MRQRGSKPFWLAFSLVAPARLLLKGTANRTAMPKIVTIATLLRREDLAPRLCISVLPEDYAAIRAWATTHPELAATMSISELYRAALTNYEA